MANTGYKSISRYERPGRHGGYGYQVHVIWKGKSLYKRISDSSAGGKRKALQLALKTRERFERKLGKPRTERIIRSKPLARRGKKAAARRPVKSSRQARRKR
ncbi:MAG: hypothetical protein AB1449_01535 [Chloroflexota bacterium]